MCSDSTFQLWTVCVIIILLVHVRWWYYSWVQEVRYEWYNHYYINILCILRIGILYTFLSVFWTVTYSKMSTSFLFFIWTYVDCMYNMLIPNIKYDFRNNIQGKSVDGVKRWNICSNVFRVLTELRFWSLVIKVYRVASFENVTTNQLKKKLSQVLRRMNIFMESGETLHGRKSFN